MAALRLIDESFKLRSLYGPFRSSHSATPPNEEYFEDFIIRVVLQLGDGRVDALIIIQIVLAALEDDFFADGEEVEIALHRFDVVVDAVGYLMKLLLLLDQLLSHS